MIEANALENAIAYDSISETEHSLNLMIHALLESLFTLIELANFSLSGSQNFSGTIDVCSKYLVDHCF